MLKQCSTMKERMCMDMAMPMPMMRAAQFAQALFSAHAGVRSLRLKRG